MTSQNAKDGDYITVKISRGADTRRVHLTVPEFNLFAQTVLAASNCIKALIQLDFHKRNGPPSIRRACYALQYYSMYSVEERNFFSEELVSISIIYVFISLITNSKV